MNNHGASGPAFRCGVEIIRDGVLGDVEQVHVFFSRGGRDIQQPPQGGLPVPKELNWNLWLAQAAWRDYHPDWINRIAWRDTSIGELGNFGPHAANMAFMALNVKEYAAPFAEFLTVGSLSTRFPGEAIDFDPATGEITNHPRAAEFLQYDYRDGWTI